MFKFHPQLTTIVGLYSHVFLISCCKKFIIPLVVGPYSMPGWAPIQWRKPGPKFGGTKNNFAVPPNSEIWGDGEKLTVCWN